MRFSGVSANGELKVRIIAGTHTVLMALNFPENRLTGLRGFTFFRCLEGEPAPGRCLRSLKVFKSVVPNPKKKINGQAPVFTTDKHPIQSFLWGDYTAKPDTRYEFNVVPMYGQPGALEPISTPRSKWRSDREEDDPNGHGVWFNRGAIASQAFAREFGNTSRAQKRSTIRRQRGHQMAVAWPARGVPRLHQRDAGRRGPARAACTNSPTSRSSKASRRRSTAASTSRIVYHDTSKEKAITGNGATQDDATATKVLFTARTEPKFRTTSSSSGSRVAERRSRSGRARPTSRPQVFSDRPMSVIWSNDRDLAKTISILDAARDRTRQASGRTSRRQISPYPPALRSKIRSCVPVLAARTSSMLRLVCRPDRGRRDASLCSRPRSG